VNTRDSVSIASPTHGRSNRRTVPLLATCGVKFRQMKNVVNGEEHEACVYNGDGCELGTDNHMRGSGTVVVTV
jgi:hypothetical protein